jgi:16S rRNA processing protein RimM
MAVELVLVGHILGPHGIGGHVKVVPEGGFEGVIEHATLWSIGFDAESVSTQRVEERTPHVSARGTSVIARLDGIITRTSAERLKGASVFVSREQVEEWSAPSEAAFDPAGYTVVNEGEESIGVAVEVVPMPAQELLIVRLPDGEEAMIPWVPDFVIHIDEKQRIISMDVPEGLID